MKVRVGNKIYLLFIPMDPRFKSQKQNRYIQRNPSYNGDLTSMKIKEEWVS